jgi:casein kinase II subunit beta
MLLLILGAHFGKTYFNLLFLTYPEFMPKARRQIYQPHIFGFRVNEKSKTGPRNQWLRQRPPEYIEEEEEEEETAEEDEQEQVGEEEVR